MDKILKTQRIHEMEMALHEALAQVQPDAHLEWKSMFGGAGFFVYGKIFAAWFGKGLTLKMSPEAAQELLKVAGTRRAGDAQEVVNVHYIEVPQAFLDHPERMAQWVNKSVTYVKSLPEKKRKKTS